MPPAAWATPVVGSIGLMAAAPPSWHALDVAQVAARLEADPEQGLSSAEAERRLATHGHNVLDADAGPSRLSIFLDQFRDVLVWLLLVAAFISGAVLGEWIDTGVILAIVLLNAILGFVQEARAEDALARLKELAAPDAVVLRDGSDRRVPAADVVPGDVLVLEPGDRIAADARVLRSVHLEVDAATLTGESVPDEKVVDPVAEAVGLGDRDSMVFSATTVTSGRGRAMVVATGGDTAVGEIAALLGEEEPPTPLQVELDRVGRRLGLIALVAAMLIFGAGAVRGIEAETMFLTAVALAVAAIPEGLAAVVTITLSRGVQRMAVENAIVRRLPAVEALGSATVVCSDKTGTLTRNEMRVTELVLADLRSSAVAADPGDPRVRRFAEIAILANDARSDGEGGYLGDPTEVALLVAATEVGLDPGDVAARRPRRDEVAFDSRRKRMTTLHDGERWELLTKGAPEVLLESATMMEGPGGPEPLTEEQRRQVLATADDLARRGLRTLAFAYRGLDGPPADLAAEERDLVLVAVTGMSDPARPEAAPAVAEAQRAGIRVVMVTGDHAVTAEAIAGELGILREGDRVMPGSELSRLSTEELAEQVEHYSVYARVDPVDKVKIVQAWQSRGDIVAMTGDGVNDAPALQAADIGVAMGSGTDVAKDASSMVLADDNFATIVSAVREGRGIFENLRKVVYFLLSANASEVLVMLLGFLVFGALGEPLLAVQLLWINLITDGLPAIALGIDPPDPETMDEPPDTQRNILSARRQLRLVAFGGVLAAAALTALVLGHYAADLEWPEVQTGVFTTLVAVQLAHAFNIRTPHASAWRHGFVGNRALVLGVLGSLVLHLAVVYTPVGQTLFDTEALGAESWVWVVALTVASFAVVDVVKRRLPV